MSKGNRFAKGSGCFVCTICGKKTRSTGRGDNEHNRQCERCYDMAGDENAVTDGDMTQAEFDAKWGTKTAEKTVREVWDEMFPKTGGIAPLGADKIPETSPCGETCLETMRKAKALLDDLGPNITATKRNDILCIIRNCVEIYING